MNTAEKIIIYQVFTRLFGNRNPRCTSNGSLAENGCGKMNDFTPQALKEIKKLGATHIWYTGVLAHATQTDYTKYGIEKNHPAVVKGKAGSPYAIRDYYDVDPDLAVNVRKRMGEFEALVERTHAAGLKMIIDFVPNHVARQYHSTAKPEGVRDLGEDDDTSMDFSPNNNFYYLPGQKLAGDVNLYDEQAGSYEEMPAKATGNNRFDAYPTPNDWYETVKLNYGVDFFHNTGCHFSPAPDTWHKMKDILLFWAGKGIDGFRCDMAEMVPCEFWGWAIPQVKAQYPELIFIAEVYNPNEYRNYLYNGHFDYLYDKVGNATKALPALIVSACMNTNPMMIYFGQELGEPGMESEGFSGRDGRTTIFDYWSIDSIRRWNNHGRYNEHLLNAKEKGLRHFYRHILNLCNSEAAIARGCFFDLMYANLNGWQMNEHKQYAFLRKYDREVILVVANFSDLDSRISVNIPQHAFDYLQMPAFTRCTAQELLTGREEVISFTPNTPTAIDVPAYGGKLLKIKF